MSKSASSRTVNFEDALVAGGAKQTGLVTIDPPPLAPSRASVAIQAPSGEASPPPAPAAPAAVPDAQAAAPSPAPEPAAALQAPPPAPEPPAPPAPPAPAAPAAVHQASPPAQEAPAGRRRAAARSTTGPVSARERTGWSALQFFVPPVAKLTLKMLEYEEGKGNFEDQMREALDDYFEKHGKKRVCGADAPARGKRS